MSKLSELQSRLDDVQREHETAVKSLEVADVQLRQTETRVELGEATAKDLTAARKLLDGSEKDLQAVARRLDAVKSAVDIQRKRDADESDALKMMVSAAVKEKAAREYKGAVDSATEILGRLAAILAARRGQGPGTTNVEGFAQLCCRDGQMEAYSEAGYSWILEAEKDALKAKAKVRAVA